MGVLRLFLALAVFVGHSGPLWGVRLIGAQIAVQGFYLISGYYMFLILSEKYRGKGAAKAFWQGRFLRLFPMYIVIALLALFTMFLLHDGTYLAWREGLHSLRWWSLGGLVLPQLTLIGQDLLLLFSFDPLSGNLLPGTLGSHGTNEFLLLPTAWSLSTEIWFYALAPFLVKRRTRTVLGIIAASVALRLVLAFGLGLDHDPWTYRFFPSEIAPFLAGGLAYRASVTWLKPYTSMRFLPAALWMIVLATTFLLPLIPTSLLVATLLFLGLLLATLPFLFRFTRSSALDRFIGDLAYPVYLSHLVFLNLNDLLDIDTHAILVLAATLLFSAFLVLLLENPINAWRQRLAGRAFPAPFARLRLTCAGIGIAGFLTTLTYASLHAYDRQSALAPSVVTWARRQPDPDVVLFRANGEAFTPRTIEETMNATSPEDIRHRGHLIDILLELDRVYGKKQPTTRP